MTALIKNKFIFIFICLLLVVVFILYNYSNKQTKITDNNFSTINNFDDLKSLKTEKRIDDTDLDSTKKTLSTNIVSYLGERSDSLVLTIRFEAFDKLYIPEDSISWDIVDINKKMTVHYCIPSNASQQFFMIKHSLRTLRMPLLFILKQENNKMISLRSISCFNTVWEDSIVLQIKSDGFYTIARAFTIGYYKNVEPQVTPLKIINHTDVIDLLDVK